MALCKCAFIICYY